MTTSSSSPQTPLARLLSALGPSGLAGLMLVAAAVAAFAWANSPWTGSYTALWSTPITVGAGALTLSKPLLLWINDGLMAVFFLLVGLEIKREMLEGALSTRRMAALPLFAALGGILVPAAVYVAVNLPGGDLTGWAVPAATDIAFALGILALLGKRVPIELKVFLTAVAVVDDLGAILIIALFFTQTLAVPALLLAGAAMAVLVVLNRTGVRRPAPYVLLGLLLWVAILKSGVHATVAGVLLAAVIPAGRRTALASFSTRAREVLERGDREDGDGIAPDTALHRVRALCDEVEPPLVRWEHALAPYVLFGIMPLFALANAGVPVTGADSGSLGPVGWGVALGLLLGKPTGIVLGAWLGVKANLCETPAALSWQQIRAAGWLGGIGFTMSLFIAGLAMAGPAAISAKLGLLLGSLGAAAVGSALLLRACPKEPGSARARHVRPAPSLEAAATHAGSGG